MTGSAVQLSSYDTCKTYVAQLGVAPGTAQHLAASLMASVLTVTAMNPWDVISTRLYQSQGKNTVSSTAARQRAAPHSDAPAPPGVPASTALHKSVSHQAHHSYRT
jgi:hypothetical protein